MVRDSDIEDAIRQAMLYDERLAVQRVVVSVCDGVVRLSGVVQSYRRALAAHEVAASLSGVRDVVNELTIEPPTPVSDDEIADHERAALAAHADVVKETITISVSGGVVTLQGSVRDAWQCAVADDVARSARGARNVRNLLVANLTDQIHDEETSLEIQGAIRRACGLSNADVHVAISERTVVLSGTVATFRAKEVAEQITRRFGLPRVSNEIRVLPRELAQDDCAAS